MTVELILAGIFGLIVGSFLNVVILRLNTGRSTSGRSGCMVCGAKLTWRELLPIISFLRLKGRCATCGSKISHQYWLVESITALLFILVVLKTSFIPSILLGFVIVSLLVVIGAYDIKHTIVPNKVVYPFLVIGLISQIPIIGTFTFTELIPHFLLVIISGCIVAAPLFFLWLLSRGAWMGMGDIKLVVGFGFILGAYAGLMAVMLGFILGAIVGTYLLCAPKVMKYFSLSTHTSRFTMRSEIPFAPFLIAGFFLVFLFNVDLIALFEFFI